MDGYSGGVAAWIVENGVQAPGNDVALTNVFH
jgi:hypothetical protein